MRYTLPHLIFALVALASFVRSDIIAFNGNECDGSEGDNVPCDGSCHQFGGRHSYRVLASGTHCVTYFLNQGCSVNVGSNQNPGNGACTNVNTGTDVQSFRCSPNSVCQNIAGGQPLPDFSIPGSTVASATPAVVDNSN